MNMDIENPKKVLFGVTRREELGSAKMKGNGLCPN